MSANPRLTALLHERAVLSKQAADVAQHMPASALQTPPEADQTHAANGVLERVDE